MIVVGLTGGIASGKSTISEMFRELGAFIIDYDLLAREVVEPYQPAWNGIVDAFGSEVLNDDLTLNREKLGEIVFDDPEKLQTLNRITHPAVFEEAERRVTTITASHPDAFIVKDVPLLIETGIYREVDKVVVISASSENQLARLLRRGLSDEEAHKRMRSQMPQTRKMEYADFIVQNDGALEETRNQVENIFSLIKMSESCLND